MNVRPDDIANLCAIYKELGTRRITGVELEKYMYKSMQIDNEYCPARVLADAMHCGILERSGNSYQLTDKGRGLAKSQKQISVGISDRAKEFLIKRVYLDLYSRSADFTEFLLRFQADVIFGTFIFHRSKQEPNKETQWLKTLSRLGFLEVDVRLAKVSSRYLGLFNKLLHQLREGGISNSIESTAERKKVGDIAEKYAVKYELQRLSKLGQDELCPLVQQISLIDTSAGYDVISFRGIGLYPEDRIYIEVKGTKKPNINFIWSRNERRISSLKKKKYWIYVFTNVDTQKETAQGPIRINNPESTLQKKGYEIEALDVNVSKK